MRVISNRILREFGKKHRDADMPIQAWRRLLEKNSFASFSALKSVFGSVDKVGEYCVFNICGQKYRLIAYIRFDWQRVYIKHVLTHKDYDKEDWK